MLCPDTKPAKLGGNKCMASKAMTLVVTCKAAQENRCVSYETLRTLYGLLWTSVVGGNNVTYVISMR